MHCDSGVCANEAIFILVTAVLLSTSLFHFSPSTKLVLMCYWGYGGSAQVPFLAALRDTEGLPCTQGYGGRFYKWWPCWNCGSWQGVPYLCIVVKGIYLAPTPSVVFVRKMGGCFCLTAECELSWSHQVAWLIQPGNE